MARADGAELRGSLLPRTASRILSKKPPPAVVLAADLLLQLLDPRVGALECLILNQRRLHKRVDRVRRPSQSIGNEALGIRVAGVAFQLGHRSNSSLTSSCSCGVMAALLPLQPPLMWVTGLSDGRGSQMSRSQGTLRRRLHLSDINLRYYRTDDNGQTSLRYCIQEPAARAPSFLADSGGRS